MINLNSNSNTCPTNLYFGRTESLHIDPILPIALLENDDPSSCDVEGQCDGEQVQEGNIDDIGKFN